MPTLNAPVVPPSRLDTFPTHVDTRGKGGLHIVLSESGLADIAPSRRKAGMLASVYATGRLYVLASDLVTWVDAYSTTETVAGFFSYSVTYSDPSHVFFSLPVGLQITHVSVFIDTTWDGAGAYLTIGTEGSLDSVVSSDDVDVSSLGVYGKDVYGVVGPHAVTATLLPGVGATQGEARIRLLVAA